MTETIFDFAQHGGWTPNPEGVDFFIAQNPVRSSFQASAPHLVGTGADKELILLYKAFKDVNGGKYIPYDAQTIGDCPSMGFGHGSDLLQALQIVQGHQKEQFRQICTEALYGAGRQCANMLRSWSDGCYGAPMAEALKTIGAASRDDLGPYDGQRAKKWGYSGIPDDVRALCAQHKIDDYAKVTSWGEYVDAMANLNPVIICSNRGFTLTRDQDGFCRPSGSWAHCMLHSGARQDKRPGGCIFQSWGPNMPTGPLTLDQPPNSFWADRDVVESMIDAGDAWAIKGFNGWAGAGLPVHWTWDDFATPFVSN